MTREEEIKAQWEKYRVIGGLDINHLISRNEELQRRIVELESAMKELQDDPYVYNVPRLVGIIQNTLDAKEQEDAKG